MELMNSWASSLYLLYTNALGKGVNPLDSPALGKYQEIIELSSLGW